MAIDLTSLGISQGAWDGMSDEQQELFAGALAVLASRTEQAEAQLATATAPLDPMRAKLNGLPEGVTEYDRVTVDDDVYALVHYQAPIKNPKSARTHYTAIGAVRIVYGVGGKAKYEKNPTTNKVTIRAGKSANQWLRVDDPLEAAVRESVKAHAAQFNGEPAETETAPEPAA